jgi:hypothetical protein
VIFIPLTLIRVRVTAVLKEPFLAWESNYEGRLKSSWTLLITPFTFSRNGWSVVTSASLAKEGTSEKRPSSHRHKVPTRSNNVSPRTFQTALIIVYIFKGTSKFFCGIFCKNIEKI